VDLLIHTTFVKKEIVFPSGKIEFGYANVVEFIKPKGKDFSQLMRLSQQFFAKQKEEKNEMNFQNNTKELRVQNDFTFSFFVSCLIFQEHVPVHLKTEHLVVVVSLMEAQYLSLKYGAFKMDSKG